MAGTMKRANKSNLEAAADAGLLGALVLIAYAVGRIGHEDERGSASPASTLAETPPTSGEITASRSVPSARPSQFSERAWKQILGRVYDEAQADRITTVAGGIAFYGLLAIFPGIAALVSLYGLIADPATIRDHLAELSFLMPPDAFSIVEDQIKRVVSQGNTELGVKFALALGFSLWSANAGMKSLIEGLNVAYEVEEKRSFIWLNLVSLGLTAAALVSILVIIGLSAVLPEIFSAKSDTASVLSYLRWPIMLALLAVGISALYRLGPSRVETSWRWVTWGGALAAVLIVIISVLLSWYLTNMADYNKTYGSLGAVIGLITWMWLSACGILVGAELNAEMENQAKREA